MNKNILEWAKKNNYKKIKYNKKIYLVIYTVLPDGFEGLYIKFKKCKEIIVLINPKSRNNKKLFHRVIKNNKLIELNFYK